MGRLARLIPWRTAMLDRPDDITRLRKAHDALEDLPETIAVPRHPGELPGEPLPIMEATLDDIAFAIVAAERESSVACRRAIALCHLYMLAREAGCVGADRVAARVLKPVACRR